MRTSERQLFRARFAWLCNWLPSDVCDGGHFTVTVVCLPAQGQKQLDPIIPEQANHPISVLCPER